MLLLAFNSCWYSLFNVSRESAAAGLPITLFYNSQGELVTSHMGELSYASLGYYIQPVSAKSNSVLQFNRVIPFLCPFISS